MRKQALLPDSFQKRRRESKHIKLKIQDAEEVKYMGTGN